MLRKKNMKGGEPLGIVGEQVTVGATPYILNKLKAKGEDSEIWIATDNDETQFVIKIVKSDETNEEIIALSELQGIPGVVKSVALSTPAETKTHEYIVMEYKADTQSLDKLLVEASMSQDEAREAIVQILLTMKDVHERGWVHRDLKLENILAYTTDGQLRLELIDFGFATKHDEGKCSGILGSLKGLAPEVILPWDPDKEYDGRAVDMYAIGVILYRLLFNEYPFERKVTGGFGGASKYLTDQDKELFAPENCVVQFPEAPEISENAKDLITNLTAFEVEDRLTMDEALEDEWIADIVSAHQTRRMEEAAAAEEDGF
jgi:serine/threonine protein kinase